MLIFAAIAKLSAILQIDARAVNLTPCLQLLVQFPDIATAFALFASRLPTRKCRELRDCGGFSF
jgi:hypothetical protein